MNRSVAEIVREYGPFPGVDRHGLSVGYLPAHSHAVRRMRGLGRKPEILRMS
jgi:hypothetical protein